MLGKCYPFTLSLEQNLRFVTRQLEEDSKQKNYCIQVHSQVQDDVIKLLQYDGWKVQRRESTRKGYTEIMIDFGEPNDEFDKFREMLMNSRFKQLHRLRVQNDPQHLPSYKNREPFQVQRYCGVRGGARFFGYSDEQLQEMAKQEIEKWQNKE